MTPRVLLLFLLIEIPLFFKLQYINLKWVKGNTNWLLSFQLLSAEPSFDDLKGPHPLIANTSLGQASGIGSHASPPPSKGGGEPPCPIGIQEVGIFMFSYSYPSHWTPGRTSMKFYSCWCGGGVSEHLFWLKSPAALLSAAIHHSPWDYSIVFTPWLWTLP